MGLSGTTQCKQCATIYANAQHDSCPFCVGACLPPITPPPGSTQERLAVEWETIKPLIPNGELKSFICRAIMAAMEKWKNGEPPRAKHLSVTIISQDDCDHHFETMRKKTACTKCGLSLMVPASPAYGKGMPLSPYSGFGGVW